MLPRGKRIPRELFGELLKSRHYFNSANFTLRFSPGASPRAAVSVSKKVSKSAVDRNRVRRRVYSALQGLSFGNGMHLFIAKPGALQKKGQDLENELRELLVASHSM